jgi:hypothetical protein
MLKALFSSFLGRACSPRPGDVAPDVPTAANENIPILGPGKDPAATLGFVRSVLARLRQENARHGMLLSSPARRRIYEECRALERALVWKYFERH